MKNIFLVSHTLQIMKNLENIYILVLDTVQKLVPIYSDIKVKGIQ